MNNQIKNPKTEVPKGKTLNDKETMNRCLNHGCKDTQYCRNIQAFAY